LRIDDVIASTGGKEDKSGYMGGLE